MLLGGRKEGRKKQEGEEKEEGREVKERVKGMYSMLLKNTSRSMHKNLPALCINMFYKPYSILSMICNWKWDLYPLNPECRNINVSFYDSCYLNQLYIHTGGKW